MGKQDYIMSTIDEYFEILDRENRKRSDLIAKSLVKYLQQSRKENKFDMYKVATK